MMTKSELIREVASYIRHTVGDISQVSITTGTRVMTLDIGELQEDNGGNEECQQK